MSWGVPASAKSTGPAMPSESVHTPLCFACSRCEYPICTGRDIILQEVPGGTTEYAFHYNLDCLLDLDEGVSVPCYCGDETVDTAIIVSEAMMEEPMPPTAKVMCMESIVESRKFLKAQQTATLAKLLHQKKDTSTAAPEAAVAATAREVATVEQPVSADGHASSNAVVGGAAATARAEPATTNTETQRSMPSEGPSAHSPPHQQQQHQQQQRETNGSDVQHEPRRRESTAGAAAAAPPIPLAFSSGPALGPEHDLQLAESIPEHGDDDDEATTRVAEERGGGPDTERAIRDAARTERIRTLLSESRALRPVRPVRRYGATSEARVDMVCVSSDVLGYGLAISTRDRSAAAVPAQSTTQAGKERRGENESAVSRLPQNIVDAASRAPPPTAWGPPGNLTVEEAFMIVTRATSSAQGQWFSQFICEDRVECPDCHLPLGFIFERAKGSGGGAAAAAQGAEEVTRENGGRGSRAAKVGNDEGDGVGQEEEEDGEDAVAAGTPIQRDFQLPPGRVPVFASLENTRRREREQRLQQQQQEDPEGEVHRDEDIHAGAETEEEEEGNAEVERGAIDAARRPRSEDGADPRALADGVQERRQAASERKKRVKVEAAEATSSSPSQPLPVSAADADTAEVADVFPRLFVGLELKRIKQIEWGLYEFQERYAKAQSLRSFRAMFPEAEELQSLYNRLSALRTQSELYNNLLRKYKEQNDVQSSLLQSQKDRLGTYEEKLITMQQIIQAQKTQLSMQSTQIQQQDELMKTQRREVAAQAQQIEVGQMLVSEQAKTIEAQRAQIRLMRAHLEGNTAEGPAVAHLPEPEKPSFPMAHGEDTDAESAVPTAGQRYEESIRQTRSLLTQAQRLLAEREPLLAAATRTNASPTASASTSSPPPPPAIQPPAHLRGVRGSAGSPSAPSSPTPPPPEKERGGGEKGDERERQR